MRFSNGVIAACAAGALVTCGLQMPQVLAQSSSGGFDILNLRWNNREGFKPLYYFLTRTKPNQRSTYFLLLKKKDRDRAIMKLDVTVPKYFKSKIETKNIRIAYCEAGSVSKRTRCGETIPAAISLSNDDKVIEIVPTAAIPPDRTIGVELKVSNPYGRGMYQFNALAQFPGGVTLTKYLGSWVIELKGG
jgi:hypothetical protein